VNFFRERRCVMFKELSPEQKLQLRHQVVIDKNWEILKPRSRGNRVYMSVFINEVDNRLVFLSYDSDTVVVEVDLIDMRFHVSNADALATFLDLIDKEKIPMFDDRRKMSSFRKSMDFKIMRWKGMWRKILLTRKLDGLAT